MIIYMLIIYYLKEKQLQCFTTKLISKLILFFLNNKLLIFNLPYGLTTVSNLFQTQY